MVQPVRLYSSYLWTSYTSMIVFFGAEFTKVYSDEFIGEAAPSEHAVSEPGRIK